jgi:hypothetical protein
MVLLPTAAKKGYIVARAGATTGDYKTIVNPYQRYIIRLII